MLNFRDFFRIDYVIYAIPVCLLGIKLPVNHSTVLLAYPLILVTFFLYPSLLLTNLRLLTASYIIFIISQCSALYQNIQLLYQSMTSILFLVVFSAYSRKQPPAKIFNFLVFIFIFLGILSFPELFLMAAEPRALILEWQRKTNFSYGINQFLTTINMIVMIGIMSKNANKKFLIFALLSYFCLSFIYLSRAHALLSMILSFFWLEKESNQNIFRIKYIEIYTLTFALFFILMFVDWELLVHRVMSIFSTDSPRMKILRHLYSCASGSQWQVFYGGALRECMSHLGVGDPDNSFIDAFINGGLFSLLLLIWLLLHQYRLMRNSFNTNKDVFIFYICFILLLNEDVLNLKPMLFFPVLLTWLYDYKKPIALRRGRLRTLN